VAPDKKQDRVAQRKATLQTINRILDDGLVLEPGDMQLVGGMGLRLVDPTLEREYEEAQRQAVVAAAARDRFAGTHKALLEQAQAAAAVARLRDALDGDDPYAVRDALAALPPEPPASPKNTLTTADLEPATR
jgi:hypothetical protein